MAIISIARMQQRSGLRADLPSHLEESEFGWCLDTRQLFIGNGPGFGGNSEILTEASPNAELISVRFRTYASQIQASVQRQLGAKLNDIASVKDFGVVGNGIVDDAPAINTAINELLNYLGNPTSAQFSKRIALRIPAGTYKIASPIALYPYLTLIGDGSGKTVFITADDSSMNCMIETADSLGQTEMNIGLNSAHYPTKIAVVGITFNTGNLPIDVVHLNRYRGVRFEDVEFVGVFEPGDGLTDVHSGVVLNSYGNAVDTNDAQFIDCDFHNLTYAILSDDPIKYTTLNNCKFHELYRGLNLGQSANFGGPYYTAIMSPRFWNVDSYAIASFGTNPGVVSSSGSYVNCGALVSVLSIYWGTDTIYNSSMMEIFDTAPGITNLSINSIILDPQQNNLFGSTPFEIGMFIPGALSTPNTLLNRYVFAGNISLPANLVGSQLFAGNAATSDTTLVLKKNGSNLGTINVATAGTTATFSMPSPATFVDGDRIEIFSPASLDATFGNISMTLKGIRL